MLPTTASVIATLRPAKMFGSACGSFIMMDVFHAVAPVERASKSVSVGTERKPTTESIVIGKKQIRNVTTTFGKIPYPSHSTSRGAIATLGTVCDETRIG